MSLQSDRAKFVTVQQGSLRGRKLQLPPAVHGHRHFTASLMKEAFFQLVEGYRPCAFFDLCGGSGQMALEALSRGFGPVHCVERDEKRFSFLVKQLHEYDIILHKKDFRRMSPTIIEAGGGVLFLDVPYSFWTEQGVCLHIEEFLIRFRMEWEQHSVPFLIAIQAPKPVLFADVALMGWLNEQQKEEREYRGHTLLTISNAGSI